MCVCVPGAEARKVLALLESKFQGVPSHWILVLKLNSGLEKQHTHLTAESSC